MTQFVISACQNVAAVSSPTKVRSPEVEEFRERADIFLATLDTRLTEFGQSLWAMIVGYQVVVLHDSSTPFLSSQLQLLNFPVFVWSVLIGAAGFIQFLAWVAGVKNNGAVRFRALLAAATGLVWASVVVAILTTEPLVLAYMMRFVLAGFLNGVMFLALSARYRHSKRWNGDADATGPNNRAIP